MVPDAAPLVSLLALVDRVPPPPQPARRGRPPVYSDRLFLKALVGMVLKRLPTVHALLAVLAADTPEMEQVRALLREGGRLPCRRTWERRLAALPATLPARIACLGRHLAALLDPWRDCGRAAAIDSTPLHARGGVWHKRDREAGVVPHTSIDTEAHWTRAGWHGWAYGWKLHVVTAVAAAWIPLAAALTPANVADNAQALELLPGLPAEVRFLLGGSHYHDAALRERAAADGRVLVAPTGRGYPHGDDGVEVRRLLHRLRSAAIEGFNGQFKAIFAANGPVPTRGLLPTTRFALGAVFVYQLTLLHRFATGADLRVGLKPFLQAA